MLRNFYHPPTAAHWQGRIDHYVDRQQWRFHQLLNCVDLQQSSSIPPPPSAAAYAFIGYASDAGVARNQGRIGAAEGPNYLRAYLASLPLPKLDMALLDVGNIISPQGQMEAAQAALAQLINDCLTAGWQPIVLGGGHEVAYGHYLGLRQFLGDSPRLGIINFDAHLDLRALQEGQGNSGTPFYQIAQREKEAFAYLPIGIRASANTHFLLQTAEQLGVQPIFLDTIHAEAASNIQQRIHDFISNCDYLQVTLDMDAFPQAISPGVSAPAAIGLSPAFVINCLQQLKQSGKIISYDLVETNPTYDVDGKTGRLAAELVWRLMR